MKKLIFILMVGSLFIGCDTTDPNDEIADCVDIYGECYNIE